MWKIQSMPERLRKNGTLTLNFINYICIYIYIYVYVYV